MQLLVLSARPDLRTNDRLAQAAAARGIEHRVVDAVRLCSLIHDGLMSPLSDDSIDSRPETVLARVGNWRPESVLAVLEAFIAQGAATPNPPHAIRIGRDHWRTVACLVAAGLPVPPTLAGAEPEALAAAAIRHLGLPVVVKQRRSRMGVGVIRCAERDHLEAVLDSLWRIGDEVVVQRWVAGGEKSHRLLVVGQSVVAAACFTAAEGEWRSNAARGGSATSLEPRAEECALATAAAAALGLGHCGVDLLDGEDGPVVVEVNPTPGFLELERVTGVDVAGALVRHAVEWAR